MSDDTIPTYGIWIDESESLAEARAQGGHEPDIIVRTTAEGHTTGSDAITIVNTVYPGRAYMRHVRQAWRAIP
jgi:hypothetical protein